MEEKRIEDVVEIIEEDDVINNKVEYVSPLKGKQRNRIDPVTPE